MAPMSDPQKLTPEPSRRETLQIAALGTVASVIAPHAQAASTSSTLTFTELERVLDDHHHVAPGHTAQVFLRQGDPIFAGAPKYDPLAQTAGAQKRQFGSECDYIGFMPLPMGSTSSTSGLLCVNHEMVHSTLMFPGVMEQYDDKRSKEMCDLEMVAHGHSIVEVARIDGKWTVKYDSPYNRRITPLDTAMALTGPAAGHKRMKTRDDPTGRRVLGTFANCAGGETPWGTVMIAEENIQHYFGGSPRGTSEEANHADMKLTNEVYFSWHKHYPRFDLAAEPHEPNRFGWMVEIDPYDPTSTPKKRTALGRFKHEGVGFAFTPDGRVAVYSGDDEAFQFIYRFVTARAFNRSERKKNDDIMDDGVLSITVGNSGQGPGNAEFTKASPDAAFSTMDYGFVRVVAEPTRTRIELIDEAGVVRDSVTVPRS